MAKLLRTFASVAFWIRGTMLSRNLPGSDSANCVMALARAACGDESDKESWRDESQTQPVLLTASIWHLRHNSSNYDRLAARQRAKCFKPEAPAEEKHVPALD